jgi:voltage-gated potassium channel
VKSIALVFSYLSSPLRRRNLKTLAWLLAIFVAMVTVYSILFHVLMAAEDQEYSWATGFYWTLTVMSTLGFGDITFESDIGRMFSMVVLVSGAAFILVLLPFTFIQFFFVPWMEHRESARAPRKLGDSVAGHLILTNFSPIEDALLRRVAQTDLDYVIVVADLTEALSLHDLGYRVMVGDLDDPATYRSARADHAALVATTRSDTANTNIAFTVREITREIPILSTASSEASVDILELAGCDEVLQLGAMLGEAMAQRVFGPDARSYVVGEFGDLLIAEANIGETGLVGQTLREANFRGRYNVSVVGLWQRGVFQMPRPDTEMNRSSVLIIAGSREQLDSYNRHFASGEESDAPVVIIGGGRVGRAAGRRMEEAGRSYRIVERLPERVRDPSKYVVGDAAAIEVLKEAGIENASSTVITTHDDDVNVYLTLYCRRLRPQMQIISRANLDRNVSTLHRAGADYVLSYASTGATAIWNQLGRNNTLVLAEGLDVFRVPVPRAIVGRSLIESRIREETGCNVVAVSRDGATDANPDPNNLLPPDGELIVIGDSESEQRFLKRFFPR